MNTAPQHIAPKIIGLNIESDEISPSPAASVVKAKNVGALSKIEESPPVNQKNCQGWSNERLALSCLKISNAGIMVIKIPKKIIATSLMGSHEKSFDCLMIFGVVEKARVAKDSWASAAGIRGMVRS